MLKIVFLIFLILKRGIRVSYHMEFVEANPLTQPENPSVVVIPIKSHGPCLYVMSLPMSTLSPPIIKSPEIIVLHRAINSLLMVHIYSTCDIQFKCTHTKF